MHLHDRHVTKINKIPHKYKMSVKIKLIVEVIKLTRLLRNGIETNDMTRIKYLVQVFNRYYN